MLSLRFDYIPYPLWRRRLPSPLPLLARTLLRPFYPVDAEAHPPGDAAAMAAYLARWRLLPQGIAQEEAEECITEQNIGAARTRHASSLQHISIHETRVGATRASSTSLSNASPSPIRLPAQWEPMERILLAFPILYPPLWSVHAQMIAAISAVADVTVLLPAPEWVGGVATYLRLNGMNDLSRVEWLILPTDDIWIRDYGPFVGYDAAGRRAAVDAQFTPLGSYPQGRDDAAARAWAQHAGIPICRFEFATEGGNYWSDGAGTLLVSDEMLVRYSQMSRAEIEGKLREVFAFDKLIMLPRLLMEETGHVDLVCKLIDEETILVNAPNGSLNDDRLRTAAALLRRETNAQGKRYRVVELPFPPLYRNWWVYPVWRSYTNSLTVNGRVLVPIFGAGEDHRALDIYRTVMPAHEVIAIDCHASANGGGAVHCLTKEIPSAL
jgi:agmatine deiminase